MTKMFPDERVLRATTLLPLLTPERRMTTVPGVMDFLPFAALAFLDALL